MIPDLETIAWEDRDAGIAFDFDHLFNGDIERESSRLDITLERSGARVFHVALPPGPLEASGLPGKTGLDDHIFRCGPAALMKLVEFARHPAKTSIRVLADFRDDMQQARDAAISQPGVYLDMSPTGTGKSHNDLQAAREKGKSLIVVPTHALGKEVEADFNKSGLDAVKYPGQSAENCQNFAEVERAHASGLTARSAVCLGCKYKDKCEKTGYLSELQDAQQAHHRIATHKRAEHTMQSLAEGRKYISIHEDATDLIRPKYSARSAGDLKTIETVASLAAQQCGDNNDARWGLHKLADTASALADELMNATGTKRIEFSPLVTKDGAVEHYLFDAMKSSDTWTDEGAMRLAIAVTFGIVDDLFVQVDLPKAKGGEVVRKRTIVGFGHNVMPAIATVIFSDATAIREEIELLLGHGVTVLTPAGDLQRRKPAVQVPLDITDGCKPKKVIGVLKSVLAAFPDAKRGGVICHGNHKEAVLGKSRSGVSLDPEMQKRITKVGHFWGTDSRGSNDWASACDLLIVLGTPRPGEPATRERLLAAGRVEAAARDGKWDWRAWQGRTVEGQKKTIGTKGYRDREWDLASRAMIHSELMQAAGRGRSFLDTGIAVVVVSRENLGLPLVEIGLKQPLESKHQEISEIVLAGSEKNAKRLVKQFLAKSSSTGSEKNAYIYLSEFFRSVAVTTAAVAKAVHADERTVRNWLVAAEGTLVRRVSPKGGWLPINLGPIASALAGGPTSTVPCRPATPATPSPAPALPSGTATFIPLPAPTSAINAPPLPPLAAAG